VAAVRDRPSRLAAGVFVGPIIATVGAFFLIQHLKVAAPPINGFPAPVPSAINPVSGGTCLLRNSEGQLVAVSFRSTKISFYLQNRAAVVDVDIVTPTGRFVARMNGSGRYMPLLRRRTFTWNGRSADGTVARDGVYNIRVTLVNQAAPLLIADQGTGAVESVTVRTRPPRLTVTAVTPDAVPDATHPTVTIHYAGNDGIRPAS
jgi:hypothetical protein